MLKSSIEKRRQRRGSQCISHYYYTHLSYNNKKAKGAITDSHHEKLHKEHFSPLLCLKTVHESNDFLAASPFRS